MPTNQIELTPSDIDRAIALLRRVGLQLQPTIKRNQPTHLMVELDCVRNMLENAREKATT